jgi:AAA+ superfamily predicted ATPase
MAHPGFAPKLRLQTWMLTNSVLKVGKTLTAECTAEAVQRPLLALSIGELVWDQSKLQDQLKAEFKRATDWNAILLLDEADVVLEARSFEDVRRNGIVSSKVHLNVYIWLTVFGY